MGVVLVASLSKQHLFFDNGASVKFATSLIGLVGLIPDPSVSCSYGECKAVLVESHDWKLRTFELSAGMSAHDCCPF